MHLPQVNIPFENDDDDDSSGNYPRGPPRPPHGRQPPSGQPRGDPPDPPDPSTGGAVNPQDNPRSNNIQAGVNKWVSPKETHFDTKLKPEIIPTWDGDEKEIVRWIIQLDELSQRSASVFKGMGDVVPTRFRGKASAWWYSLPASHRENVSQDWDSIKREIQAYWMNQTWVNKTQLRALEAKYREREHYRETPTEYYIQKLELLQFVYKFTPLQIMSEVLRKAPQLWSIVLNPYSFTDLAAFQTAIKFNEGLLIELGDQYDKDRSYRPSSTQQRSYLAGSKPNSKDKNHFQRRTNFQKTTTTRAYAIGWNDPSRKPPHPRDDSNVSKGRTPADYGARGCMFCGSTKHWDRECKFNKGNAVQWTRAYHVGSNPDDMFAEAEYELCYLDSQELSDSEGSEHTLDNEVPTENIEEEDTPENFEDERDF